MDFLYERIGNIVKQMQILIYSQSIPINSYKTLKSDERFTDLKSLDIDSWDNFDKAMIWGGHQEYYWFATEIEIPDEYAEKNVVFSISTGKEGEWDATNPQFSIFVNGEFLQGLDVNHREVTLSKCAVPGEKYSIILSAFTGDSNFTLRLNTSLRVLEPEIEDYYYNLLVPYQVLSLTTEDDESYYYLLNVLNESINLLDLRKVYSAEFYDSLFTANHYLMVNLYDKCKDLQSGLNAMKQVYCVGHTHIDIAWLWTLRVTQDKAVRSFSTVLRLMEEYPEYIFMSSQPQLYKYVKQYAPLKYKEIKKRVAEGRWEVEGGMFVEADCNLTSGESLVRQFLYGKQFFRNEFGKENEILWLPDVFGYSAALPQIMQKCGIHYFMTTKISWNDTNKLPYDTFLWRGIDGTTVLAYLITTRDYEKQGKLVKTNNEHYSSFSTNYNGMITPSQIKGALQRYQQKYLNDEVLVSYGYGDGGGGPTKEQLETERRLHYGIPGCPQTKQATALSFFKKLEEVNTDKYLPVWSGELYLEFHRGTYTSMARNKKYNRKAEFKLLNSELFSVVSEDLTGVNYPATELIQCWEVLMRNQFHDILPGSSIAKVYEESKEEYNTLFAALEQLQQNCFSCLAKHVNAPKNSLIVFNPNSFESNDFITFSYETEKDIYLERNHDSYPCQKISDNQWISEIRNVSAKGYSTFLIKEVPDQIQSKVPEERTICCDNFVLDNKFYRITFNKKGQLASIYDKEACRELLKEKCSGNVFMSYEDRPYEFDSWEISSYYQEKEWEITELISFTYEEDGPVRKSVRLKYSYLDSMIDQYIYLYNDSRRIDFKTDIDWKQSQILLKVLFPLDIHNDEVTFDIQYGNIKRNMSRNTSWDNAKFEVCHHKWMDISEDNYGVSLLNDSKYGISVYEGNVGLSLIKSGIYPNPEADQEQHSFTYSLFPHLGNFKYAGTIKEAYQLNNPFYFSIKENDGGTLAKEYSFITCNADNIFVEVVKKSEDGQGIIVRLFECFNRRSEINLKLADSYKEIYECNMLEEKEQLISCSADEISLLMKPYEIKTILLKN